MELNNRKRFRKNTETNGRGEKSAFENENKNEKSKEVREESRVNGAVVILKGAEVQFWAAKKFSKDPRFKEKFAVTVKLSEKHLEAMMRAKEAAIQHYLEVSEDNIDPKRVEFEDSVYYGKDGDALYTFRSESDFREITELEGVPCDPDLRIGKGTTANLAIRANAIKVMRQHIVIFYLNAANITSLVEFKSTGFDLRDALREP